MPYDPMLVQPMREELTQLGVTELMTAEAVDVAMKKPGTTMVIVNSVCGCAAGGARPGVAMAIKNDIVPDNIVTVFAGQDLEATERVRSYFTGQAPSSPCVAIMRDGELVAFMPRHTIEGRTPEQISGALTTSFNELCAPAA